MKPDIYYCHKCKRSHGEGECGKRAKNPVAKEGDDGAKADVEGREKVPAEASAVTPESEFGSVRSVAAERNTDRLSRKPSGRNDAKVATPSGTPTQSDIDALLKAYQAKEEHKRRLKREQMQRYRARSPCQREA